MTFDNARELPRSGAADQPAPITGASEWNSMQQLNKDEKKFFSDLNGVMVQSKQLPNLDLIDGNGSHSGSSPVQGNDGDGDHDRHNCDQVHVHDWKRDGQNNDRGNDHDWKRDGQNNDQDNDHDWKRDGRSNENLSTDAVQKELQQDIGNIASDLKSIMPPGPVTDGMIKNLQQLADNVIAELIKSRNSGTGADSSTLGSSGSGSSSGGDTTGGGTNGKNNGGDNGSGNNNGGDNGSGNNNGGNGGSSNNGGDSRTSTPTGRFEVKNGRLYDPSGKEFIPNGINVDSRQAMSHPDQLVNQYHFNFMRIGMHGVFNSDGSPNFATLDQLANTYSKLGVPVEFEYPITDNQSVLTGSALQKAESWYSQVANHFKDNPYVFLATPNESGDGTTNNSEWLTQTKGILTAIKDSGNNNPIVVDDTRWSGAAVQGDPSKSGLIQYADQLQAIAPNLVAAEHDYSHDSQAQSAEYLSRGISALQAAGYTPFIQEFGPYNFGGPTQPGGGVDAVLSKATMQAGVGYNAYVDTFGYSAQSEKNVAGPQNQDALILPDGSLSSYGQRVVAQNEVDQRYVNSLPT